MRLLVDTYCPAALSLPISSIYTLYTSSHGTVTVINMRNPAMATFLVAMALTALAMLPLGVSAGSYRRPVVAAGTVTNQPNQTVFGLSGNCYDIPLFDFCTNQRIGIARDCLHDSAAAPDCAGGINVTTTTTFMIEDTAGTLTVRS